MRSSTTIHTSFPLSVSMNHSPAMASGANLSPTSTALRVGATGIATGVHLQQLQPKCTVTTIGSAKSGPNFLSSKSGHKFMCSRRNQKLHCSRDELTAERGKISFNEEEKRLIEALIGIQGRGRSASSKQLQEVERAVRVLEDMEGVPSPTSSGLIEGSWKLTFTTRPEKSSPIQRTLMGVDLFSVFQEVYLRTNDPRVSNIVKFSDALGLLKVEAAASIENESRITFRFDRAAFSLKFLPFKLPYPVPFKLLGDKAKGWLDTTYLSPSGNIRISRGNKGTTFVLQKEIEPRQRLLSAISTGNGVEELINEFISTSEATKSGENLDPLVGEWKMLWSSQMETDSWLENAANGLMGTQVIKKDGQMKFLVDILAGFKFSMTGTILKSEERIYDVKMDDAAIVFKNFGLPVEMESGFKLELLYGDERLRITRGYNRILFVHLRMD